VGDDRLRHELQPGRAHALRDPRDDELRHVLREAAGERRHEEDDEGDEEHEAGSDEVADLAQHGQQHGARERVADDDPAHLAECAELTGDGGERRRDDRVIERAEDRDGQEGGDEEPEAERRERHSWMARTIGLSTRPCVPSPQRHGEDRIRGDPDVMSILDDLSSQNN